jgi:hypothetical protein
MSAEIVGCAWDLSDKLQGPTRQCDGYRQAESQTGEQGSKIKSHGGFERHTES